MEDSKLNFCFGFPLLEILAVSQIERTWNQNQGTCINILSGNFEEKNESKNCADQQFQISIRRNSGDVHQAKSFENEVLHEVTAKSQKEEHHQFERSRCQPNFACRRKRDKTCDKCKVEKHCNAIFFCSNHFLDENILQREKESCSDRNAIKDVELKIIIGCPSCNNRQSDESDQSCDPSKFCYIFAEKNFRQHQRKQRDRPENNNDLGQRQVNYGVDVEKETYCAKDSANNVQEKLVRFKRRSSLSNHERKQGNQSEKKSEKSYFESVQSLSHKFRNNIVGATDKHLAEKKRNSSPISIQGHKFSEIKSRLLITFMVRNENIF